MTDTQGKPTPGPWSLPHFAEPGAGCQCGYVLTDGYLGAVCTVHCSGDGRATETGDNPKFHEACANARLIAEAGNVYSETGLTPRELHDEMMGLKIALDHCVDGGAYDRILAQRNELRVALSLVREYMDVCLGAPQWNGENPYPVMDDALSNTKE